MEPFERYYAEEAEQKPNCPAPKIVATVFTVAVICAATALFPSMPASNLEQARIEFLTKTQHASAQNAAAYVYGLAARE